MQETQEIQVWSLDWEDTLEKEMATHSSILASKIAWTEKPGGLQFMGSCKVRPNWSTEPRPPHTHLYILNSQSAISTFFFSSELQTHVLNCLQDKDLNITRPKLISWFPTHQTSILILVYDSILTVLTIWFFGFGGKLYGYHPGPPHSHLVPAVLK